MHPTCAVATYQVSPSYYLRNNQTERNVYNVDATIMRSVQTKQFSRFLPSTYVGHVKLRRFALRIFHSHSGATGVFCLICRTVYFRYAANLITANSKIGVRRLKVGDLLIQNISTLCITMSSIPCSRSVVISVPLSRQRRHLERIQCV